MIECASKKLLPNFRKPLSLPPAGAPRPRGGDVGSRQGRLRGLRKRVLPTGAHKFPHPSEWGVEENRKGNHSQTQLVVGAAGEQLQVPLSASEDPAEGDLHEAEHEPLHPRGGLQTESFVGGDFPHEPDVEVADQGRKYHEHSIFLHEREGQVFPPEVVVLHVEGALRGAALVVELHHFLLAALPVVGQNAAIDVAVEQGGLLVFDERALHHKPVAALGEEGRERQARQPALLVVDFRVLPFLLLDLGDALFQSLAVHSPDIERVAVAAGHFHHLLAVGAAVHARLVHPDAVGLQLGKSPLQGFRLLEFHIGIPVPVFDVERVQVQLSDAGEVAVGFLVGVGRVVLLSLDELVVVVEDHGFILADHPELQQGLEQQAVQLVVDVEPVGLAALHCLHWGVLHRQSAQVAGDGVCAAEAVVGVRLESLLPEEVHILQHFAATQEDGCEILDHVGIGELCIYPFDSQRLVNQSRLTRRTELADNVKNSAEAVDLLV